MIYTIEFVFAQVIITLSYLFFTLSYLCKDKRKILICNMAGAVMQCVAYFLLDAWSGFYVNILAVVRTGVFLLQNIFQKNDKKNWVDILLLVVLNLACVAIGVFTFEGILSLLPILATVLYTISLWQDSPKVYRYYGLIVSTCWILYNIFVSAILGAICESVVLATAIVGIFLDLFGKSFQNIQVTDVKNVHSMKLRQPYFDLIKNGIKVLEGRLNDEKRKQMSVGDRITFFNSEDESEFFDTTITQRYEFENFEHMAQNMDSVKLGFYGMTNDQVVQVYRAIYSQEDEQKYGVVVFEIKKEAKD